MKPSFLLAQRNRVSGVAMLEMALVLPVLLILALPTVDYARNMQTQTVLNGMAREGANLASRSAAAYDMQTIMDSMALAAPALGMRAHGTIYITQIHGSSVCRSGDTKCHAEVVAQYKWLQGHLVVDSGVFGCASSSPIDGHCSISTPRPVSLLDGKLYKGQVAYAVETFYQQDPIFGALDFGVFSIPALPSKMRAIAIF